MIPVYTIIRPLPRAAVNAVSDRIQLTSDQKQKLLTLSDKSEQVMRSLDEQLLESLEGVRSVMYATDKDGSKLREATDKAAKAEAAVISAEMDFWNQVKTIITDAQLIKLQEIFGRHSGNTKLQTAPAATISTGTLSSVPAVTATPVGK